MEGTRPLLVEIQALASRTGFGTPQRVATGLDHRRLAVLLAVLERRGGLPFGQLDVFVNVTGGVRLLEPSTDLAVMAALVSSVHDRPLPADALFLGEVGLGGEIRPVAAVERRLGEAARPGFRRPPPWRSWSSPCRRAAPPGRRSGSRRSSVSASHSSPAARAGRNRCARGLPPCRQAPASCWCTTARDRS